MDKDLHISAAENWYSFRINASGELEFKRVALWAADKQGSVRGLVSGTANKKFANYLYNAPYAHGGYIHWDDMTPDQQKKAKQDCQIDIDRLKELQAEDANA
ncbi:hypothetical protein [Pseudoalteromonas sp. NJ631]|uniref:hypothetical protein n=1 Tax=Pseudoalteromonas sp. NJ631 TaxID=493915 RepID=UPI0002DFDC9B|nr:hypothetical protein [Pseudoalteromonas sp. NJ631]